MKEEQFDLFNKRVAKPAEPQGGTTDKSEVSKTAPNQPRKRIFSEKFMKKTFGGDYEKELAEKPNETNHSKSVSGSRVHPKHKPESEAEKSLGWMGRYYDNDPN